MSESARTTTYVVVAAAAGLIAWFASPRVDITPNELIGKKLGQPFYPDFKPTDATMIRVVSFDEKKAESKLFAVRLDEKNGWIIPSHHDYPADAADRLVKTSASLIGIKREELQSDSEEDYEQLGVVDPLDPDGSKLKGRGQRITLSKGNDVLVDLIIGKQPKERAKPEHGNFYYVRSPSEKTTYVATLDIDLSTKFSDWVETKLLKLNRDDLTEIVMNNYSIDEEKHAIIEGEINTLTRAKPADPWKLEGLDEAEEEVDTSKTADVINTLDSMKLVGVRPKQKGLTADLTLDREFVKVQSDLDLLLLDLQSKGFILQPDKERQLHLYSNEGELTVATNKGVVYALQFGEVFTGDEAEIEIGDQRDKKDKGDAKKDDKKPDDDGDKGGLEGKKSSRYLYVATRFDEKYAGPKPQEPERPEGLPEEESKPKAPAAKKGPKKSKSAQKPARKKSQPADGEESPCGPVLDDGDEPAAGNEDEGTKSDEKPAGDDQPADKSETESKDKPDDDQPAKAETKKTPADLKKEYETLYQKYEADLKAWETKVKEGQEKVEELNERFGAWYYVISADDFKKLHLGRKDLVKAKTKPGDEKKPPADKGSGKEPADEDADSDDNPSAAGESKQPDDEDETKPATTGEKPADDADDPGKTAKKPSDQSGTKEGGDASKTEDE